MVVRGYLLLAMVVAAAPGGCATGRMERDDLYTVPSVAVTGEENLALSVVYPPAGARIASYDSNFIFGSVRPASASLSINGTAVEVHPNGAFLAWLPLPPRGLSGYELVAARGVDTLRRTHPVQLLPPPPDFSVTGVLVVDSGSVTPRSGGVYRPGELVRVSVRASAGASVRARIGTRDFTLVNGGVLPERSAGGGAPDTAGAERYAGEPTRWATEVPAELLSAGGTLHIREGSDSVVLQLPSAGTLQPESPLYALLGGVTAAISDTDRFVIARPSPGGTYKWLLFAGTYAQVTGREGGFVRIRMDSALESWVPEGDVQFMPPGFAAPRANPGNSRLVSAPGWVDLVIPMGEKVPFAVRTTGRGIELTLHGVRANLDNIVHPTSDSLVLAVTTVQETSDRATVVLHMSEPPFGYLAFFEGRNMVLRVRRTPQVHRSAPLRGLTIAVDAGHPPAGATGPTGVYEGVVTLQIARRVQRILEGRGAHVLMTRETDEPVELALRPVLARRSDAHALVSIHLNALPDGVNPFVSHGTSTYYFQDMSVPLAREVQGELLRRLQLRDLGVMYNTFAVTRPTWMPSVLCEGAFLMIPEQEAAASTPAFQEAYALAVADGLQRYFASLGR